MMRNAIEPEVSVVVPVLNDAVELPGLFETLAVQNGIRIEVVICDGGSTDATCETAVRLAAEHRLPLTLVQASGGRGVQLNAGAAASRYAQLLFLHADSRLPDRSALHTACSALAGCDDTGSAFKFSLRFARASAAPSPAYYFYESKARLLRPECTHGDQGLLMSRETFTRFGPFDEFPPMLAETLLAERLRTAGELQLSPAELVTSARRFETEGLYERQVINAILMNCAAQGWHEPFREVADIYREQRSSSRLHLAPLLGGIHRLIKRLPAVERRTFWRETGGYVRRNAWQIAFLLDVRNNYKQGVGSGSGPTPALHLYDSHIARRLDNRPADLLATALTWCWFTLTRTLCRYRN